MSRTYRRAKPGRTDWRETLPTSSHDWITPNDVVQLALGAFYMASGRAQQHWRAGLDGPQMAPPFVARAGFQEELTRLFDLRVRAFAQRLGVPGFDSDDAPEWLNRASPEHIRSETELRPIPPLDANSDIHRALF